MSSVLYAGHAPVCQKSRAAAIVINSACGAPASKLDLATEVGVAVECSCWRRYGRLHAKRCPCGGLILSDTDGCPTPLCNDCAQSIWREMA